MYLLCRWSSEQAGKSPEQAPDIHCGRLENLRPVTFTRVRAILFMNKISLFVLLNTAVFTVYAAPVLPVPYVVAPVRFRLALPPLVWPGVDETRAASPLPRGVWRHLLRCRLLWWRRFGLGSDT